METVYTPHTPSQCGTLDIINFDDLYSMDEQTEYGDIEASDYKNQVWDELKKSNVKLQYGDIVRYMYQSNANDSRWQKTITHDGKLYTSGYRNSQIVGLFDGNKLIEFVNEYDEYGAVPREFVAFEPYPIDYWDNATNRNRFGWINTTKHYAQLQKNVEETSSGWSYHFTTPSGQIIWIQANISDELSFLHLLQTTSALPVHRECEYEGEHDNESHFDHCLQYAECKWTESQDDWRELGFEHDPNSKGVDTSD